MGRRRDAEITSARNPRVLAAARLRDRRAREANGLTLIDGWRELRRAIDADVQLDVIFLPADDPLDDARLRWIESLIDSRNVDVLWLAPGPYRRVAYGQSDSGPVAVAHPPRLELHELTLPDSPLIAVLEGIEKPGNLGAVLRSADGAGVDALVAVDSGTDLFNPNVIRASLGTVFAVPACSATASATRDSLNSRVDRIVVTRVDGSIPYTDVDFRGRVAIVLGSEASGVGSSWQGPNCVAARIPMLGVADSLNVSAAAAVLFYEALRQRSGA